MTVFPTDGGKKGWESVESWKDMKIKTKNDVIQKVPNLRKEIKLI